MAQYFAGNSMAAFSRTSASILETTTGGTFDSTYVANSIQFNAGVDTATSWNFSATGSTIWARFDIWCGGSVGGVSGAPFSFYNGGVGVFRLIWPGSSNTLQPQYWNGTAWTNTGGTLVLSTGTNLSLAVQVVLGSGFNLYLGGVLQTAGSGWTGGQTAVTNVVLQAQAIGFTTYMSQIMVADYDLRNSHYMVPAINGNSATNTGQVTGAYTDINEVPLNDSTLVEIQTHANKAGFTKAGITVPIGYQITAMVINARSSVAGGTITDGKLGIRSAGANFSSTGRGVGGAFGPVGYISATDPATGLLFTQTGFNNAEFYLEAA